MRACLLGLLALASACDGMPDPNAPIEVDDDWWVPMDALPPGSDTCPPGGARPLDVDIDGDGTPDAWSIGPPTRDETGKTVQVVCVGTLGEYLLVNGRSVGKCPWPQGRNIGRKYARDSNHDRVPDDTEGDGIVDALGWFLWVSSDGPLPGEPGVTHHNYRMMGDEDGDGLIDITAYTYHGGFVTKRHFELDWADPDMEADEIEETSASSGPHAPRTFPTTTRASSRRGGPRPRRSICRGGPKASPR